jgi:hypothetical protein
MLMVTAIGRVNVHTKRFRFYQAALVTYSLLTPDFGQGFAG